MAEQGMAEELASDLLDQLKRASAARYAIERELGQGGMATVQFASDPRRVRRGADGLAVRANKGYN